MCQQESMSTCGVIQLAYEVTKLLSESDILYLKDVYDMGKPYAISRYYNLFSMYRLDVKKQFKESNWIKIQDKLNAHYPQGKNIAQYFLKYVEGSFCVMHVDSPARVNHTAITLIDKSIDLQGGEILLHKGRFGLRNGVHFPTDEEAKSSKLSQSSVSKIKPIMTVPQNIGETIWYPAKMSHGVSYVTQGYRLVLITWYKDENNQIQEERL